MHFEATFRIAGIVQESFTKPTQKGGSWSMVKVATLGIAFELKVTQEQQQKIGEGEHLVFEGRLVPGFQGRTDLKLDKFSKVASGGGAKP